MADPRFLRRRQSLVATAPHRLSEGTMVNAGERTTIEIAGGPPFGTLDIVAGHTIVGSVVLDQVGAAAAPIVGLDVLAIDGRIPLALRHRGCTILAGLVSIPTADETVRVGGS